MKAKIEEVKIMIFTNAASFINTQTSLAIDILNECKKNGEDRLKMILDIPLEYHLFELTEGLENLSSSRFLKVDDNGKMEKTESVVNGNLFLISDDVSEKEYIEFIKDRSDSIFIILSHTSPRFLNDYKSQINTRILIGQHDVRGRYYKDAFDILMDGNVDKINRMANLLYLKNNLQKDEFMVSIFEGEIPTKEVFALFDVEEYYNRLINLQLGSSQYTEQLKELREKLYPV